MILYLILYINCGSLEPESPGPYQAEGDTVWQWRCTSSSGWAHRLTFKRANMCMWTDCIR